MKLETQLKIFVVCLVFIGCSIQEAHQINIKNELIKKLIATEKTNSSKSTDKIIILKTKYCESFDCKEYFREYKAQIQIYSREDAFMRAITNYYEIENIDEKEGVIILHQKIKGKFEKIEIRI